MKMTYKNLINSNDKDLKQKVADQFKNSRNERIKLLGEDQSKK